MAVYATWCICTFGRKSILYDLNLQKKRIIVNLKDKFSINYNLFSRLSYLMYEIHRLCKHMWILSL